jgi:hypothetical protein
MSPSDAQEAPYEYIAAAEVAVPGLGAFLAYRLDQDLDLRAAYQLHATFGTSRYRMHVVTAEARYFPLDWLYVAAGPAFRQLNRDNASAERRGTQYLTMRSISVGIGAGGGFERMEGGFVFGTDLYERFMPLKTWSKDLQLAGNEVRKEDYDDANAKAQDSAEAASSFVCRLYFGIAW